MSSKSSKSDPSARAPIKILVGRVRKPHGIRGDIVIDVQSDVRGRFDAGHSIEVVRADGSRWLATIERSRLLGKTARISLKGVEDRDAAEELRGATLEIAMQEVPPAPDGSYYFFDLVGCDCTDWKRGALGQVVRVVEDGGGLLLEVASGQSSVLIPFVRSYLSRVDIDQKKIELELPEGLAEICTSKS